MRKTIAVDVDGVLSTYDGWRGLEHFGDPIPGSIEFIKQLAEFADILIFTTRCCTELGRGYGPEILKKMVKEWLDKHGYVYHDIWIGQGKPICSALIDDRAIPCIPQGDHGGVHGTLGYNSAVKWALALCSDGYPKRKDDETQS